MYYGSYPQRAVKGPTNSVTVTITENSLENRALFLICKSSLWASGGSARRNVIGLIFSEGSSGCHVETRL